MSPRFDLHTHTTYCDGKNTPEEMVRAALAQGLSCIGFTGHGYAPYDLDCCMTREGAAAYRAELAALRERYAGRIRILCGVEQDYWSDEDTSVYDYVIGSVHYVRHGEALLCVDNTPEIANDAVTQYYGGDWYAFAEAYFKTVADVVDRTHCQIIGHFDLVSKFNEKKHFFDERHPRYVAAWQAAADRLLRTGVPFEINTGGISRGWRTTAYPTAEMIDYLRARGARLLLSSDSHSDKTLCFGFAAYEHLGDCLITRCEDVF
ncbi:MAG: histidinol-phosphatase [Oscillospiraceae bacterium]|nr:histidinol-phosphatase [Oscillospiraceae bacterium]